MKNYIGVGIKQEQIENYNSYKEILNSLTCCICLDIVKNPVQCEACESLYCDDCWDMMKISGKKCVLHCTAVVKKASKFVRDTLSLLRITCENCMKTNIEYNLYVLHVEVCSLMTKLSDKQELSKFISEKEMKVDELTAQIEQIKLNDSMKSSLSPITSKSKLTENLNSNSNTNVELIRKKLLTFNLDVNKKMELYTAAINGDVDELKKMITVNKYPPFEEVSGQNYLWTAFHYAMHYGKEEVILFYLEYSDKTMKCLNSAVKLKSNDGRCPFLSLLKSNAINSEKKLEILKKIASIYKNLDISEEAKGEIKARFNKVMFS